MNLLSKKDAKELAKALLEKNGKKYDEWIHEKHIEIVINNLNLVKDALIDKKTTAPSVEEERNENQHQFTSPNTTFRED